MTIFIQNDTTGAGLSGDLDPLQGAVDLTSIAKMDTGFGLGPQFGDRQQVIYTPGESGPCPDRLNLLVNTAFQVDYGNGSQSVDIVILPCKANFVLNDGTLITTWGGVTLPPANSGLQGAMLNNSLDCLIIYDTTLDNGAGMCVTNVEDGDMDLPTPTPVLLYHEMSHASRIVTNTTLAVSMNCNPSSPEEKAAMTDENDMRVQYCAFNKHNARLRDVDIYCGQSCNNTQKKDPCHGICCIIASVASGSAISAEVQALRMVRDTFLRTTEAGFAFFDRLLYDYYDFSPQVCTLMARQPALPSLVLRGFVRPLLRALQLLISYGMDGATDAELGAQFAQCHGDPDEAADTIAALTLVDRFWSSNNVPDEDGAREISVLLRGRALQSEHVRWALIAPVRAYGEALTDFVAGADSRAIGTQLRQSFDDWSCEAPLDHVWASLPVSQLERELHFCETYVMRSDRAKVRFRARLMDRFADITAIRAVVGAAQAADAIHG